jgi:hypothetical protein
MNSSILNRRKFVKIMAVGTGITTCGVMGVNATGKVNYSDPAYLYWNKNSPGALKNEHYLVLCAALAASAHNTQPWRFDISENAVNVYADLKRNLGEADKERRLMVLSVGCAIENIHVAANYLGLQPEILLQSDNDFHDTGFAAKVSLTQSGEIVGSSEKFNAIFNRQTTRAMYLDEPIEDKFITKLTQLNNFENIELHLFTDKSSLDTINTVHAEAVKSFVKDDAAYQDSLAWWRYTREELLDKRDGISIYTSAAPSLIKQYFTYTVTGDDMRGDFGRNGESELMLKLFASTPLWAAITTTEPGLSTRLNGGRLLERLYLSCIENQYRIMPITYATEQPQYAQQLLSTLKLDKAKELLSIVRIGKSDLLERAVRRPLAEIIA